MLIVTRSRAIDVRTAVTVAPVTRTSRGIASEVPLGWSEGLRAPSVANCDSLMTIPKASLSLRIGTLSRDRRTALDHALAYALEIRSLG